ncbi:MAG: JAB domain-containing protein, partial [Syntrophus sp. (in: bacteria)]
GSLSSASIYPRELIKRVLDLKSAAVLVTHNHPSGNTSPSEADRTITRKMILSLAAIDVILHDHIIVGDGYHSMSEDGCIQSIADKCRKFLAQHN